MTLTSRAVACNLSVQTYISSVKETKVETETVDQSVKKVEAMSMESKLNVFVESFYQI